MIASPDKFQAIIMNERRGNQITHKSKIPNIEIETTKFLKLVGIKKHRNNKQFCIFQCCCPLVCDFCSCESSQKIEKIQKQCLRLVLDNCEGDDGNLIKKNGNTTMEIKRLRTLATEIFKTINNINPSYMKNIFTPKTNTKIRPNDIIVRIHSTATYGNKILTALRPKVWNKVCTNIKSLTSITKFKEYMRT